MGVDDEATSSGPLLIPQSSSPPLSSQSKTFANVFIAIVGAGVLGLPYTFRRTGYIAGILMLLLVGALTYHCMLLLVLTRRKLSLPLSSFGDLGLAAAGPLGLLAVDSMIVLSQCGFCIGYLIFISNTLSHLLSSPAHKSLFVTLSLPFQIALNSIPSLTHLAPLSLFADAVDVAAMAVVMVQDVALFIDHQPPLRAFGGVGVILYGLGVAVYAFEGIGMVIPLEQEAANKDSFPFTLGLSMASISIMYALFGALGYFAFGDETKDIITTNFGRSVVTLLVQLGLCINLFFTFPIMMHPVFEVAERWLFKKRYCMLLRWALVIGVSMVAVFVPNFTDFMSLVGSSVCCMLGFVLPALFHLKVFGSELSWFRKSSDVAIIVLGLVVAVSGTWSSLTEIFSDKV